jgi:dienelactone hydrolase
MEQIPPSMAERSHVRETGRREFLAQTLAFGSSLVGAGCLAAGGARSGQATLSNETPAHSPQIDEEERDGSLGGEAMAALREERFDLEVEGRMVPGILWQPDGAADEIPIVLAGHGGGFGTAGHKRVEGIVELAARLADYGIATIAIDQPGCGDRPGADEEQARRRRLTIEQAIEQLWTRELVEEMTRDWQASLDHLRETRGLGDAGVGYWGLSGGTTFGLPLVATEPRIQAAVLGLNSAVPLMLAYAPRVTCPVLYTMNLDDHFMTRDQGLALFDALATQDKFVLAYPGDHGENLERATSEWARFLAIRLGAPGAACAIPTGSTRPWS